MIWGKSFSADRFSLRNVSNIFRDEKHIYSLPVESMCLLINEKCYQASIILRWCVRILNILWFSCAEKFHSVDDETGRSGTRGEIFLTKQLNFLIYIIRTWEIGRLVGAKRYECGMMLYIQCKKTSRLFGLCVNLISHRIYFAHVSLEKFK